MPAKEAGKPRKKAKKDRARKETPVRPAVAAADRFIGDRLKAIYDSVVAEPVPDQLLQLLNRLDTEADK
jgi:Anti-sigma factor NepR